MEAKVIFVAAMLSKRDSIDDDDCSTLKYISDRT